MNNEASNEALPETAEKIKEHYHQKIDEVLKDVEHVFDRSNIIVSFAKLEGALKTAIEARIQLPTGAVADDFERHMDGDGAFGSAKAKILLGYAVGLYGNKTYSDLDTMRDLRNLFAHNAKFPDKPKKWSQHEGERIKGNHPLIANICANLTVAEELYGDRMTIPKEPSERFTTSAQILRAYFTVIADQISNISQDTAGAPILLP